jgi:integrase
MIVCMCPQTLDLFDDAGPVEEARRFQDAFDQWLAHQRTLASRKLTLFSSVRAYTVLWQAFAEWCLAQSPAVSLDTITEADIGAFINSRLEPKSAVKAKPSRLKEAGKFTPRHAWRLLTLIDGVLEARARNMASASPNRSAASLLQSREDWLYANANRRDKLPSYLAPAEARVLVNYLSVGLPRSGRRGADITWQELRNRAAVALHLGSGLTPGDVRVLRVRSPVVRNGDEKGVPGTVRVPSHGDSPEREAPIIKWAGRVLAFWQKVREEQALAGDFLFPATRSGKQWGKVTHYDAVKSVLEASGIDKSLVEGGAYRLRHTFALRQLRRGKSPDLVAKWLGVVEMRVMDRYRRVDFSNERPD